MIIDGTNLILGRLATEVAKKALLGETIEIVNVEKIIITGTKDQLLERYKLRRERGTPTSGPFFPREPHLIVKRTIRGMLPYKQAKGRDAFDRIKCHKGIPARFDGKPLETIKEADSSSLSTKKFLTVGLLSKLMGAK
jgi:large subunit ribosomal protein L13